MCTQMGQIYIKITGKKVSYFGNKTFWFIQIWNLPDSFKKLIYFDPLLFTNSIQYIQ